MANPGDAASSPAAPSVVCHQSARCVCTGRREPIVAAGHIVQIEAYFIARKRARCDRTHNRNMCRRDEKDGTQTRVCAKGPGDSCWAIVLGNRAPEGFSFATVCVVCYLARVRVFVCVHVCVLVFMFLCMCVVLSCSHPSWGSQQRRPDPSLRSKVRICCTPASGVRIAGPFADDPTVSRVSSPPPPPPIRRSHTAPCRLQSAARSRTLRRLRACSDRVCICR